jgi:hypothetical protein
MKTISLVGLVSFLVLSGLAVASQSGEQKDHSTMMQRMMKGDKQGTHKDGMMRMMKMIDQCAAMMESTHNSEGARDNQK